MLPTLVHPPAYKSIPVTDERHPCQHLQDIAEEVNLLMTDEKFARHMDKIDPIGHLRQEIHYPKMKDIYRTDFGFVNKEDDCVYFSGHSLGLCPKKTKYYMDRELEKWAKLGVQGHWYGDFPWELCDEQVDQDMATLVGAKEGEVAIMNSLTVNLHLLLISFYKPTPKRHKIMCESKCFPSDHYAFESQVRLHGYNPETSMIFMEPRKGEVTLRTEDILKVIEKEGDSIAVICFGGLQYFTGQLMNMEAITKAGHAKGCYVGFDLAHAAGNVPLFLHDWNVDFACWCTYKYLNSSAGCLACIFLHSKHENNDFPKLQGWWGHKYSTRFVMDNKMDLSPGAYGYRVSNPACMLIPLIRASLDLFKRASMVELRRKSKLLTAYLEYRIRQKYPDYQENKLQENGVSSDDYQNVKVHIFTPSNPEERGAQLSLSFSVNVTHVHQELEKRGVLCDVRKPSVIRVAPVPLYCSFMDVHRFMGFLDDSLKAASKMKGD